MKNAFVAVDWGTTSLRAYAVDAHGHAAQSIKVEGGIQSRQHAFEASLAEALDALPDADGLPVLMAGMIGSRQGWVEAPYVAAPCNVEALALRLTDVPTTLGRQVKIVPGVSDLSSGIPDVMRGEETQLLGLLQDDARAQVVCMPGTHCKWVRAAAGTILGFRTYMTGEAFKLFSEQSILSRLMRPNGESDGDDWTAFDRGLDRAAQPGHLLHHLFAVRTQGLFDNLEATALKSYLSGILVGHEVMAAQAAERIDGPVVLVGDGKLTARYERALAWRGLAYHSAPEDIVVRGLTRVARAVDWLAPQAVDNRTTASAATPTSRASSAASSTSRHRP